MKAVSHMDTSISTNQRNALERLLQAASAGSGQSEKVANFLLAWWNADDCGGFNLIDLWAVDSDISSDMVLVFSLVRQFHKYPDTLGYKEEFEALVRQWRPNLT